MTDYSADEATLEKHLQKGLNLIEKRSPGYTKGRGYYEGDIAEMTLTVNRDLQKILQASAETHKLTFAAIPVDALMDKVILQGLTADDKAQADTLAEVFEENDLEDEADDWHKKAGYFGDYYAIIDPTEELIGEDGKTAITALSITGSSPLTTVLVYSPRDERTPLYGVKAWDCTDHWEALTFYDDAVVAWTTPVGVTTGDDATKYELKLELDDDGNLEPESAVVSHEETNAGILLHHFRADGKPYGKPVHRNAYGPQDAINKIHATELAAMDYQGFPWRYGLIDSAASIADDDMDEDFGTDGDPAQTPVTGIGADGQLNPVNQRSKIRSTPGSMAILSGLKSVGQFDPANSDNFLKPLDWEVRAMGVITGTPLFEFDLDGEQPSGEARRRASGRINKHAGKIRRTFGQTWEGIGNCALALLGKADAVTKANFAPVETELDADGLDLVKAKVTNGVPIHKALVEAGYDEDEVEKWWPAKDSAKLAPQLWQMFGEMMRFVTAAQTGDVITQKEVGNLLPDYLTEARESGFEPAAAGPGVPGYNGDAAPGLVPTGKLNGDGTPEMAPPKGVMPPALAPTALPAKGVPPVAVPPVPPAKK